MNFTSLAQVSFGHAGGGIDFSAVGMPVVFILVIGLGLGVRLLAGSMDGDRVERYVRGRGGRLLSKRWAPFGRGWFGDKSSRIYEITYADGDGNVHQATCKTSLFSGVYFTEDAIVSHRTDSQSGGRGDLEEENRRLREKIARMERGES